MSRKLPGGEMQNLSIGVRGILDTPELTNDAIEHARWNPEVGCLVDQVQPNRPLLISFGFAEWKEMPDFDFFGRSKKFESRTNLKLNRILIRDIKNAWYHRGVPGLGSHVDEVAATLRGLIRSIRPSRVWTIGQSMGGYAALLFGMLLEADRIIAFGPLSHLDHEEAIRYGDRRFLPVMRSLAADRPKSGYYDLVRLGRNLDYRRPIHVVFGTHPGIEDDSSGNLDAIHAIRLERLANVSLYPYPDSDHLIVKWLSEHKQIDELLETFLLGEHQEGSR
jgi:pimeloyl-ACP methyl ester carboxylesterase